MNIRFDGKRALVTGAGRGIGREIAIAIASCGAETIALDVNKNDLEALQKEFPEMKTAVCDLGDWEGTKKIVESLGHIDLLVNNAGVGIVEDIGSIKERSFDLTISINLRAAVNLTQIVSHGMIERKQGGSIVNISSQASMVALQGHVSYSASKAGLDGVTRVMALELGKHQIRVNTVNPTVIMTDMGRKAWDNPKGEPMKKRIPLGRFAEVEDVVHPVLFLLSDKAAMINGVSLPVDGGVTAC